MPAPDENVIDKIRKLHKKAESAEELGSIAEAQAFAAKVQEMMLKHKLGMSDIEWNKEEEEKIEDSLIDWHAHGLKVAKRRSQWQEVLCSEIARYHSCRILIHPKFNRIWLVGRESDRKVAEYLIVVLTRTANEVVRKEHHKLYVRLWKQGESTKSMRGYKSSWLLGFVARILERCKEIHDRVRADPNAGTALVRINNALTQVDKFMEQFSKSTESAPPPKNFNTNGYQSGKDFADSVNLNPGIESNDDTKGQLK